MQSPTHRDTEMNRNGEMEMLGLQSSISPQRRRGRRDKRGKVGGGGRGLTVRGNQQVTVCLRTDKRIQTKVKCSPNRINKKKSNTG